MAHAIDFEIGVAGFNVWIEYNANNSRIQSVSWIVPTNVNVEVWIWDSGSLVINQTIPEGTGSQNIAGNYRMVDNGEYLELPPNIIYQFQALTTSG